MAGETALHHSPYHVAIVAFVDDKLQRGKFSRFVIVGRDLGVLLVGILAGLDEPLPLLL